MAGKYKTSGGSKRNKTSGGSGRRTTRGGHGRGKATSTRRKK